MRALIAVKNGFGKGTSCTVQFRLVQGTRTGGVVDATSAIREGSTSLHPAIDDTDDLVTGRYNRTLGRDEIAVDHGR